MNKNLRFFENLNQGNTTGYNYTWTLSDKRSAYYKQNQQQRQYDEAVAKIGDNVFFGINPTKTPKSSSQRATNTDVCRLNAIFADLDCKSASKPNNPESIDGVVEFLDSTILPPPNYIVNSGNGIHAYWIIENGFTITNDNEREKAKSLSKGFVQALLSEGEKLGYKFDNCSDLARVGRMPGSYNNKEDTSKSVEIIRESEELFTFDELCEFIPKVEAKSKLNPKRFRQEDNKNISDKVVRFEPIYEGCPFIKDAVDNAKSLSEPAWYHTLTIVSRCENGRTICHQISEGYADYDFDDTERKVSHALSESNGPTTCKHIANELSFEGCKSCPIKQTGKLTSPIGLGLIQSELARIVSKYVYCLTTNQYFEVEA